MSNTLTIVQELSPESLSMIRDMITEALRGVVIPMVDEDTLLKIDGAAALLGVSEDTIRSYARAKHIKAYKKGKLLYFSRQELTAWIKSSPRKPGVRYRAVSK